MRRSLCVVYAEPAQITLLKARLDEQMDQWGKEWLAEGIIESIEGMDGGVDELLTGPEFQWLNQTDGKTTLLWSSRSKCQSRAPTACVCVYVCGCLDSYLHKDWWSSTLICFISENSLFVMQFWSEKKNPQNKSIFIRLMWQFIFISTSKIIYVLNQSFFLLHATNSQRHMFVYTREYFITA